MGFNSYTNLTGLALHEEGCLSMDEKNLGCLHCPKHQEVLDELLRKIKVKPSTTPEDLAQIVNQAMTNMPITFSDEDLPKPHAFHNNAIYIMVRAKGMTLPHVLVDGGSSLNICQEMRAKVFDLKEEEFVSDPIIIYGFDNHGQIVKGKIFLDIFINYSVHTVLFHVVNVPPTYNLLLGRTWIHNANVVPSTLHQCIKWSKGGMITTILGEDPEERLPQPMIPRLTFTVDIPSIRKSDEINLNESLEILKLKDIQTKENVAAVVQWQGPHFFKLGGCLSCTSFKDHPLFPQFSKAKKGFDLLIKYGYQPFRGLGKNEDGRVEPIIPARHFAGSGLRFTGQAFSKGTIFIKRTK